MSSFGFDMQYPGMAIHNVLEYLEEVDPPGASWATAAYDCLLPFANGPDGRFPSGEVLYGSQPLEYRNGCRSDTSMGADPWVIICEPSTGRT